MLYLEIITPDGVAWKSENVEGVSLPTRSGEIRILPGHIPLVTMVEAGEIKAFMGGKSESLAVDKGYARCVSDTVSVLTEAAIHVEEIDLESVEEAKARAMQTLEKYKKTREADPAEIERLESTIRFAIAQQLSKNRKR
ncbi:MAG: ATP synthase F1 subunit epsilon [Opitutales bacterium]|nr:ATP synthase F1 subunit epsilon [Opitutales bacterium]